MKPQSYLTKEAKVIFKNLVSHIDKIGLEDIDSYRLSDLAHAIDMVQRANYQINNPSKPNQSDGVQQTPNGYTQVTGYVTIVDKFSKIVDTLGAKYGLTPADREKIKGFEKKADGISFD